MSRSPWLLAATVALIAAPSPAQDKPDELADVRKRLDKLEAETAALRAELAELRRAVTAAPKPPADPVTAADAEKQVRAFAKEVCEDLVIGRLAAVYRATSAGYRKATDRDAFEEKMKKSGGFRVFAATADDKKAREAVDLKPTRAPGKWTYYYTRTVDYGFYNTYRVNVDLVIVDEGGEWKVAELDIRRDDN